MCEPSAEYSDCGRAIAILILYTHSTDEKPQCAIFENFGNASEMDKNERKTKKNK